MAWRRTSLTFALVVVLAGRKAVQGDAVSPAVAAFALCGLLWVAFLVVTHRRIRELRPARPAAPRPHTMIASAVAVVAVALLGVVVVWPATPA